MQYEEGFPYPTFFELILIFNKFLDLKPDTQTKKLLDDKRYERNPDLQLVDGLISRAITEPLVQCTGSSPYIAKTITQAFKDTLSQYTKLVARVPADGVTKEQLLSILWNSLFKFNLVSLLRQFNNQVNGPNLVTWFMKGDRATSVTLDWIEKNEYEWKSYISGLDKEAKDRIASWKKGTNLPSSLYVSGLEKLGQGEDRLQIDWSRVKLLLLVSRAIDAMKRDADQNNFADDIRLLLWGACEKPDFQRDVLSVQNHVKSDLAEALPLIAQLQHRLMRTVKKTNEDQAQLRKLIDLAKEKLPSNNYWLNWHEARWFMYSGDLGAANDLYKKAFKECLFNAGENQEYIINEALVVAANRSDLVFLKKLKRASITFGYDIPSIPKSDVSNQVADLIEEWEIHVWEANLTTVFPEIGLFPGCTIEARELRKGPLIVTSPGSVKPNYRYPNRKIWIGETWKKRVPQLIWFLQCENYEVVEKLLKQEARVDVKSDSDDSPIQIALEALNVTDVPYKSLDDRFFNMLCQHDHKEETMNNRSQKLRLLPIILAVESGKPEVVQKVLEMGASSNGRGHTDEQTALNVCLKYIGAVKDPDSFWKNQKEIPITPEVLDSIRRYCAGISGFTLEQQRLFKEHRDKDLLTKVIKEKIIRLMRERICEKMTLENMREIAKILIQSGADVNAEHRSPLPGYTPLMMAAELDERVLFDLMLMNDGDPGKKYSDPVSGKKYNCWEIASVFGSKDIQVTLYHIGQFFRH